MLPQDPEREAIGRSIAALLMAQQIKRTGQVHPETLLTEIGALAGFAVQMSIRKSVIERQKLDPDTILVEVATKNDEIYYFSDLMNWMLFENTEQPPYSVWSYVAAAVPPEHQRLLPDIPDIVSNAARSIGTKRYGVPRLPREHMPNKLPRAALEEHWRFIRAEFEASAARSVALALRHCRGGAMADADRPRHHRSGAGRAYRDGGGDPDVEGRPAHHHRRLSFTALTL